MGKSRARRRTTGYAKAHFAECVREAEAGASIVLTRHGRDVARLEPIRDFRNPSPGGDEHGLPGRELAGDIAEPAAPYGVAPVPAFLSSDARRAALRRHLAEHIWPHIPTELLGTGVSKREQEEILGYRTSADEGSTDERLMNEGSSGAGGATRKARRRRGDSA